MVLKCLEIRRFKCLREHIFEFQPGLNIVRGANEAGKSTLRAALMAVLFANPTSQSETVDRWTSWGQAERCEMKLIFINRAGHTCLLRKDFAARKVFLTMGDESFQTYKTIQSLLAEELGIANEEFYALCASLDVRTLSNLGNAASRKEVGKMLAGLMTGSESGPDVLQTLRKLEESLKELGKGMNSPSKTPGPLKSAEDAVLQLAAERQKMERELKAHLERQREVEELLASIRRDESRLQDLDHLLAANRKLVESRKRKQELATQDSHYEQSLRRRQQWMEELAEVSRHVAAEPVAAFTGEDLNQLRDCQAEQSRLTAASDPAALLSPRSSSWLWSLLLMGPGLLLVSYWWPAWILIASGGVLAILAWQQSRKRRAHEFELRRQAQERESQLTALAGQIRVLCAQAGGLNAEEIQRRWPEVQQWIARKSALEHRKHEFDDINEVAWKEVRSELRLILDTLQSSELLALQLPPVELAGRERERSQTASNLEANIRKRDRIQAILDHDQSNSDKLSELDEAIAAQRERKIYLESRGRVGQLALDFLHRSRRATLSPARQILEERAGKLLDAFSGGRYRQISVDDEDLTCKLHIPETDRWEDPAILSQGAFDQFYLSLRMALSEILAGGQKAPYLLDEPLAAFDSERMRHTLQWLKVAARERQILFFTCRDDYDAAADHVIVIKKAELKES